MRRRWIEFLGAAKAPDDNGILGDGPAPCPCRALLSWSRGGRSGHAGPGRREEGVDGAVIDTSSEGRQDAVNSCRFDVMLHDDGRCSVGVQMCMHVGRLWVPRLGSFSPGPGATFDVPRDPLVRVVPGSSSENRAAKHSRVDCQSVACVMRSSPAMRSRRRRTAAPSTPPSRPAFPGQTSSRAGRPAQRGGT